MNDQESEEKILRDQEKWIVEREKQLQSLTVNSVESGIKFLFATNAGGVVSILTYLGAIVQNSSDQPLLKTSLAFFFIGLIFIGIYRAFTAEIHGKVFWDFNKLTKSYVLGEMEWATYIKSAEEQVLKHKNQIARIFVYTSFVCFLLGASFGILGLIK
jgi:hypothetical protein